MTHIFDNILLLKNNNVYKDLKMKNGGKKNAEGE